jgi:hypothetical protein
MLPRRSPHRHLRNAEEEQDSQADNAHDGQRDVFAVSHLAPQRIDTLLKRHLILF